MGHDTEVPYAFQETESYPPHPMGGHLPGVLRLADGEPGTTRSHCQVCRSSPERGDRLAILLVEDNPNHAELIRRAFELQDVPVSLTVAATLHEARDRLAASVPDLVIADMRLPDGNGLDILPAEGGKPCFPMVVLTAHGDEQTAVEAMERGALDYVVKSEANLADVPRIARRALCEWGHIVERRQAEEALKKAHDELEQRVEDRTRELTAANRRLHDEITVREAAEEAWVFVILLSIIVLTGIIQHILHRTGLYELANVTYIIHLMSVVPWLLRMPFSKWSHLVYRPLAMYLAAIRRDAIVREEEAISASPVFIK